MISLPEVDVELAPVTPRPLGRAPLLNPSEATVPSAGNSSISLPAVSARPPEPGSTSSLPTVLVTAPELATASVEVAPVASALVQTFGPLSYVDERVAWLVVLRESTRPRFTLIPLSPFFWFQESISIGREDSCDLIITDDGELLLRNERRRISRKHSLLEYRPREREFWFFDANSTCGSFVRRSHEISYTKVEKDKGVKLDDGSRISLASKEESESRASYIFRTFK